MPSKIITILFLILLTAYPALAVDSTSSSTRREKVQAVASREAALKAKLETFRNKQKATAAARINTNLNKINQNQTSQMKKHLERMSSILDKLEARINSGSPDIKNAAAARTALVSSRSEIATVSAAVEAQAAKDYTLTITSESKVKSDATSQRKLLHQDLLALRKAVIDAKQSVANAIRKAKSGQ